VPETDLDDPAIRFIAVLAFGLVGLFYGALAVDSGAQLSPAFVLGVVAVLPLVSQRVRCRLLELYPERRGGGVSSRRDAIRLGLAVVGTYVLVRVSLSALPPVVRTALPVVVAGAVTAAFVLLLVRLVRGLVRPAA